MIPYLLAAIGGYLIGDSMKGKKLLPDNAILENGGQIKWQDVNVGDSARVISENKMGVIFSSYGRKFNLKFADGTEKTYDANELEFYTEMGNGGSVGDVFYSDGDYIYEMGQPNYSYLYIYDNDNNLIEKINLSGEFNLVSEKKHLSDAYDELEKILNRRLVLAALDRNDFKYEYEGNPVLFKRKVYVLEYEYKAMAEIDGHFVEFEAEQETDADEDGAYVTRDDELYINGNEVDMSIFTKDELKRIRDMFENMHDECNEEGYDDDPYDHRDFI
jgi:hypothetical protein